jgi:hypothetical protein
MNLAPAAHLVIRPIKPLYVMARERIGRLVYAPGADMRTGGVIPLSDLKQAGFERSRYKPSGWSILPRALPPSEVCADDVFIDYGSGMGRIVYEAAARYAFARVIWLELSPELNRIAQSILDRNRHLLRCSNVELVTADVLDYDPPPDITVAFFANPFTGATFETAIRKLLAVAQRPLRIVYFNPIEHERLLAIGRMRVVRRLRGWRPGKEWSRSNTTIMYEYSPAADQLTAESFPKLCR